MISSKNRTVIIAQLIFLILVSSFSTLAAGEVDTSFLARLTTPGGGWGLKTLFQPDGKILIAGEFKVINGIATHDIVRLSPDGARDSTFNAPEFYRNGENFTVNTIALQSNGKILVCGRFSTVGGEARSSFVRLNSDGSVDTTFPHLFAANEFSDIEGIHVFPDDSFMIGGSFTINSPSGVRSNLARLNADGSLDASLNYTAGRVGSFVLQPDGKIVVGWHFDDVQNSLPRITRVNSNGSPDPTFVQISVQANTGILDLEYLPDGKILIGGSFNLVNGSNRVGLFRANADGTVDATFTDVGLNGPVGVITLDGSGKFYIGGSYSQIGGASTAWKIHLLNADGTRDMSFFFFNFSYSAIGDISIQPDGKIIVCGRGVVNPFLRIHPDGGGDPTFIAPIAENGGSGLSVLVQPDNKILVGGQFTAANGVTRGSIVRFNADGTLDSGFTAAGFFSSLSQVYDIALQPDGKILITGLIGDARRMNANGTADVTFSGTNAYWDIECLPDGKILIGGSSLRRYNSNGTLDTTLATVSGGSTFPSVYQMAVQPDGKIIIVGNFLTVNGASRNRIARLNADGTFDASFNTFGADTDIFTVALQADGKILIGGNFTSFNFDFSKKYLARLHTDGSIDTSFAPVLNSPVLGMKIQPDGRLLIGGSMSVVNGALHRGIARINPNGSLDTTFNAGAGPNSTVWNIDQQSDGKIIYVGQFSQTNNFSTLGVGRLLNSSAPVRKFFDFDGDGKADVSVFRPSENKWYVMKSSDSTVIQQVFAIAGDVPVPADYDGDGKTDMAIYRPSNGDWWSLSSLNGSQVYAHWGEAGVIPRPSDFDGDGKSDYIYFLPSNSTWYRFGSSAGASSVTFGISGDKPVIGDFDGDGKSDVAIFRPSTGDWWYAASSAGGQHRAEHWGVSTDIPAPADYDGDGKTDFAVYRPSTGAWYIFNSSGAPATIMSFGISEDKPVPADYDGDGKADIAVFRPSNGAWYLLRSTDGFFALSFGISTDIPVPNAFVP